MGIRDRPWPFSKRDRPRKTKGEKRWVNLREKDGLQVQWLLCCAARASFRQAFWQYPFFYQPSKLPRAAVAAASGETVNTDDGYARLMTCNVYKGRADAREQLLDVVALLEIGNEAAAPAETFGRIAALLKQ